MHKSSGPSHCAKTFRTSYKKYIFLTLVKPGDSAHITKAVHIALQCCTSRQHCWSRKPVSLRAAAAYFTPIAKQIPKHFKRNFQFNMIIVWQCQFGLILSQVFFRLGFCSVCYTMTFSYMIPCNCPSFINHTVHEHLWWNKKSLNVWWVPLLGL